MQKLQHIPMAKTNVVARPNFPIRQPLVQRLAELAKSEKAAMKSK